LYILIFKFFDSNWEDRRFWTERSEYVVKHVQNIQKKH
jgi:hypothetical protein